VRRKLRILVALVLGACGAPKPAPAPVPQPPLSAQIAPPFEGDLSFRVNRAAYVAIFAVTPERGVTLMYPGRAMYGVAFGPGMHVGAPANTSIPAYAVSPASHVQGWTQPTFLYVVASAKPLKLERLATNDDIRSFLGPENFLAKDPFDVMRLLTGAILPDQSDEDWATDLLVSWESDPVGQSLKQVTLDCPNGRELTVPVNLVNTVTTAPVCHGPLFSTPIESSAPPVVLSQNKGEAPVNQHTSKGEVVAANRQEHGASATKPSSHPDSPPSTPKSPSSGHPSPPSSSSSSGAGKSAPPAVAPASPAPSSGQRPPDR